MCLYGRPCLIVHAVQYILSSYPRHVRMYTLFVLLQTLSLEALLLEECL